MLTVSLEEQIVGLEQIINRNSNDITFIDIISLAFHAILLMSKNNDRWKNFYEEFEKDLEIQNKHGWPKLFIIKNNYSRRIDIFASRAFDETNNFLMLLLRMLYIENYKTNYFYDADGYYLILSHKMNKDIPKNIRDLSLDRLFLLIESCIGYYMEIYYNENKLEHQIGRAIMQQL